MRIADHPDIVVGLDHDRHALLLCRLGVTLVDPLEDFIHIHVVQLERDATGLEASELEQVADQPLDALTFLFDHLDGALSFLGPRHELRQGQRFRVAADRRERRHQFMRHVGEQLPARAIGLDQLLLPRRQIGGHAIERLGDSRDLIPAHRRRARGEIAFTKPTRRIFDRAQPRLGGTEYDQRGDRRAANQQEQHADHERRADRFSEAPHTGERRHPRHRDDGVALLDRRHDRSAPRRTKRHPGKRTATFRRRTAGRWTAIETSIAGTAPRSAAPAVATAAGGTGSASRAAPRCPPARSRCRR